MTGSLIIIALLAAMAGGLVLAAGRIRRLRGQAAAAERRAAAFKAEIEHRQEAEKKAEEVRREQEKQRARVNTGDPAADFDGSLDVLSDLSKRRAGS